jgi:hypothetical protein
MFYLVYYYHYTGGIADIYLAGLYRNIEEAKTRLNTVVPNYKKHINNTVSNGRACGWVSQHDFGDIPINEYTYTQIQHSVNLFN